MISNKFYEKTLPRIVGSVAVMLLLIPVIISLSSCADLEHSSYEALGLIDDSTISSSCKLSPFQYCPDMSSTVNHLYVYRHVDTGVYYVCYSEKCMNAGFGGLCVMLNADGTPYTGN